MALASLVVEAEPARRPTPLRLPTNTPLLTIVVPTFNEERNVELLVDRLAAALAGVDFEVVFVDDSTDRTPQIILGLQTPFAIKLIHREAWEREGGLTTALVCGLRAARGTYVSVIDGDLQHPPEKLTEMLSKARASGADVVVASRYREGGSAAGLPGVARRIVSVASKWISKALFYERLQATSDPGSGFFLLRKSVIEGVDLRPVGYKMLTEILVRGRWNQVEEVPYAFQARQAGTSKAGARQGWQYLQHSARMFVEVPHVARLWKFLTVGVSGTVVNLSLLWSATTVAGAPRYAGWAFGVEASVLTNFWLNRTFTWRDRRGQGWSAATQGLRYHISSIAGILANLVAFSAATSFGAPTLLAGGIGIIAGVATNFLGASQYVFSSETQDSASAPEPMREAPGLRLIEVLAPVETGAIENEEAAA